MEFQELSREMAKNGICIAYVVTMTKDVKTNQQKLNMVEKLKADEEVVSLRDQLAVAVECLQHTANEFSELENKYKALSVASNTSQSSERKSGSKVRSSKVVVSSSVDEVPESRCSETCPPGYRKAPINGLQACCHDCVQCSEGEVSNVTDSDICQRCPDEEWPDERKETCRPKIIEYLPFDVDVLTPLFSVISLLGSVISAAVLRLFISFWDTPVVKANNRTVSIILLTSILLSFLCVFLFLGRPVDITCILRQVSFGIFFTISVSCVLAKTIIVCIAFKTTKPGSFWNKWVGTKLANYVVLLCSSVQVLICVVWLSVSHPYQEYDMSSYHEKIIIQCNEGSVIGFYIMLGYLGFLAALSFVLAFMVRTLPDSFNEAKYITFSMLVFCSVWIAMIPAYLSTRGKYMVAVEIFAILTSCAGLLGCIFFPKLYIFVIKPEMNTRLYVAGK
ncbi:vomeronasal type-2 receptor 26-like [Gastrophryne carolinensis]